MKYPCIPVWMKPREKDHFDYPLRSKKEITFEQYLNPPRFNVSVITNDYKAISENSTLNIHKADNRNNEVTLELDMRQMYLSPLQKKRLIFLLGPRWKGDGKVKIVSRKYTDLDHNLTKAFDTLRQLYWEAKRAPIYVWSKMKNWERRAAARKIFGKVNSKEELERLKKEKSEEVIRKKEKFNALYDTGNYTPEVVANNLQEHLDNVFKGIDVESTKGEEERIKEAKKLEEALARDNYEKQLVKKQILSKKAYETFFNLDQEEEVSNKEKTQQ